MLSTPPKTGNATLDAFLQEIYLKSLELEEKTIPEEGWSLTDLRSDLSEVISDRRDLIDIVTKYDDLNGHSEAISAQKEYLDSILAETRKIDEHSQWFAEIMEWWDQNYRVIQDSKATMSSAAAADYAAAAKTSETNAKAAADAAAASATKAEQDAVKTAADREAVESAAASTPDIRVVSSLPALPVPGVVYLVTGAVTEEPGSVNRVTDVYVGAEEVWPSVDPPQRVTVETDAVGWFPTAPTHPLVAGLSEYAEISFTTDVWANKPMRDYEAEITYPARSVIPAGTPLFVPDTNISVKVTLTEYVPAFPPQPVSVGLAGPHDWDNCTLDEYQGVLADMTSMGMERIRISALWDRIESVKGTYRWDQIDMLVNTAVAAGIQPLVVLMGVPSWTRPDFETAKGFRPEWEAFCTAVATRYVGVVPAYEIWNEPNLDRFWHEGNALNFHDVLSRAVTKIKEADPHALVISGGLAPTGNSTTTTEPLDFIRSLYTQNALQGVDGIGWHPYSFPEMPSGTSDWNMFRKMDELKDLIEDNNHAAQIWITEIGAPTGGDDGVGEEAQAAIIDDGLNLAAEDPLMGPVFVYTHQDLHLGEDDMESWFGVYASTGAPKPAVATIQAITATRHLPPTP